MAVNYERIPEELKWCRNWAIGGPDDNGTFKLPHFHNGRKLIRLDVTTTANCCDFESALEFKELNPSWGIGFVLSETDTYTCIDLDVKNHINYPDDPALWTSQENLDRFWKIVTMFDSYTERSASGQGLHIWLRGRIGLGVHGKDGVEVYSQERFIVCTGDVVIDKDIESRQELLDILVSEMRKEQDDKIELVELDEIDSDEVILERARSAHNADKFNSLMECTACVGVGEKKVNGTYWDLGYPSQSEADLALMSIFTFYSDSNEQCRRLFRLSNLAKRAKATKNNRYLNFTLTIIRSRQAADDIVDEHAEMLAKTLLATLGLVPVVAAPEAAQSSPAPTLALPAPAMAELAPQAEEPSKPDEFAPPTDGVPTKFAPLDWPPGMIGSLAQYMFSNSPRPVKEVSIVAALGLMAGICGKAFTIPQSGLNLYIVLVARSAIGKEAMHGGIADVLKHIRESTPDVMNFVDFNEFASGPALSKATALNTSFVNVSGEWGKKLKRLSSDSNRDPAMDQLRTVMTNLFQKSGPGSIVGGMSYSDKDKNVASVSGISYSMIGETTPGVFYDALTDGMMEDGFMSRFIVVEYGGERPDPNEAPKNKPDPLLIDHMCGLVTQAARFVHEGINTEVQANAETKKFLREFNRFCDIKIKSTDDEGWRQMWNRAHLKVLRLSALMAVGDDYVNPVMNMVHVGWAIDLIYRDIAMMSRRMTAGDVGVGDSARERKLLALMGRYLTHPIASSYGIPEIMKHAAVVPRKYLQLNTQKVTAFTSHRGGSNVALDAATKSLIDSGYIVEMDKAKVVTDYAFHGKCYRIINLPGSGHKALASCKK
jgi:hypothetical protein